MAKKQFFSKELLSVYNILFILGGLVILGICWHFAWHYPMFIPRLEKKKNWKKRVHQQLGQAVSVLAFLLGIFFITWAIVTPGTEDFLPVIGVFFCLFVVLSACYKWRNHKYPRTTNTKYAVIVSLIVACIIFPGLIMLAAHRQQFEMANSYKPLRMSVTKAQVAFETNFKCEDENGKVFENCNGYRGRFQINWDGAQGWCKEEPNPTRVCSAWYSDSTCEIITEGSKTTMAELEVNSEKVENCTKEFYGAHDLNNFTLDALGTCKSPCLAIPLEPDRFDRSELLRRLGFWWGAVGLMSFLVALFCAIMEDMRVIPNYRKAREGKPWYFYFRRVQVQPITDDSQDEESRDSSSGSESRSQYSGSSDDTARSTVMADAFIYDSDDSQDQSDDDDDSSRETDESEDDDDDDSLSDNGSCKSDNISLDDGSTRSRNENGHTEESSSKEKDGDLLENEPETRNGADNLAGNCGKQLEEENISIETNKNAAVEYGDEIDASSISSTCSDVMDCEA